MLGITDPAFRLHIVACGKPDVMYTEFVSVDGLCSPGRDALLRLLRYEEVERPIIAQFFGKRPDHFKECAELAQQLGFDGIDINMGCPDKSVCNGGSGAALINDPELASEIIVASIEGAGNLPVAVKTRIGYTTIVIEEWARCLLETNPAAITFHLRTRKELTRVPAHWELMHIPVEMARDTGVMILGNGDVKSLEDADRLTAETGADGVMIGRGVMGNPWVFNRERIGVVPTMEEKFDAMMRHARIFEQVFPDGTKGFYTLRKHMMAYPVGVRYAKELRKLLEAINCSADVEQAIATFKSRYPEVCVPEQ